MDLNNLSLWELIKLNMALDWEVFTRTWWIILIVIGIYGAFLLGGQYSILKMWYRR